MPAGGETRARHGARCKARKRDRRTRPPRRPGPPLNRRARHSNQTPRFDPNLGLHSEDLQDLGHVKARPSRHPKKQRARPQKRSDRQAHAHSVPNKTACLSSQFRRTALPKQLAVTTEEAGALDSKNTTRQDNRSTQAATKDTHLESRASFEDRRAMDWIDGHHAARKASHASV